MANAVGGLLVYGVEEETTSDGQRIPARATPLEQGDSQARLEDVAFSAVAPLLNLTSRTIAAPNDGCFVVVRVVHQRTGPLHMVEGYGQNRYFIRTGLSTRPMQAYEVAASFSALERVENRVDALLGELPLIARLTPSRSRTTDSKQGAEPGDLPWVAVVIAALDAGDGVIPMRSATRFDFPVSEAGPYIGNPGYIHRSGSFQIDAYGYVAQHRREGQPLGGQLRVSRQACSSGAYVTAPLAATPFPAARWQRMCTMCSPISR